MKFFTLTLTSSLAAISITSGFVIPNNVMKITRPDVRLEVLTMDQQVDYRAGAADTEFAKRYSHLVGKKIRTVGQAFTDFTKELGRPINALYRSAFTDIVGTTHLILVNARFERDAIWSLGLVTTLDLILKNYPDKDIAVDIESALMKSLGMDGKEVRAEADMINGWAEGKTKEEIESALRGDGDSLVAEIAKRAKSDEYWMYSRFFGVGLVRMMDIIGLEADMDSATGVIESWLGGSMGKDFFSACSDSDLYFKTKAKLNMMETLMKEVEIREKKRMAERLEEKAEAALRQAERDQKLQEEIDADEMKR